MMTAFNTLEYSNKIKEGGIEPKAAEAISMATAEVLENLIINRLATKDDIKALELATRNDIKQLEMRLIIKLGSIMITGIGLLACLIKFGH
jgi:uncharacterized membrane protein YheB (UPF0754 family)